MIFIVLSIPIVFHGTLKNFIISLNHKKKIYFFFQSAMNQTITFNTSLDSEKKNFFCSTLSEFENFLRCERILINLTTCQNETSS
jgi:hypothetical protein